MKKSNVLISWGLYVLSLLLLAYALFFYVEVRYSYLSFAVLVLTVPWIICLVNAIRNERGLSFLWVYLLVFFGLIGIPLYLIKIGKISCRNNQSEKI
jgi:hypothetical protein